MNIKIQETKENLKQTMALVHSTLYKTIEFQLLFKIFYISIFLFVINFLVGVFLDALNLFITTLQLNEALNSIPIVSLFDFQVITVLSISLFIFMYVYLIEKNGVIIMTSKYYKNNFIGFFKTLLLSVQKTPIFIWRRIKEMRFIVLLFIGLYMMWKILGMFTLPEWIMSTFSWVLIFYGAWLFFSVLFRYTFTAYTTCLYSSESYTKFNAKIPEKFMQKRTRVTIVFYTIFILVAFLWLILFSLISQTLLYFLEIYPDMISTLLAFFISFTIISILIVLSFMKTFKVGIMTILYFEERKRQQLPIEKKKKEKQPLLSKNIYLSLATLLVITTIFGALITTTIKTKTDNVISNANEYIEQVKETQEISNISTDQIKDMQPKEFIETILPQDTSAIDTIETFIFTFLAYIIIK